MRKTAKNRQLQNILWGLFIGDALAMPAHWYYSLENLKKDFGGGVTGYTDPPHPHPESFMVGSGYYPDIEQAKRHQRPYEILHDHAPFYNTSYGETEIPLVDQEPEHGHHVPPKTNRYHYHHGLRAGENTLGANLTRLLIQTVNQGSRYIPERFLEEFVTYMTDPEANKDPYLEIYIREWFERFAMGFPFDGCAQSQRNVWSIGSHGGMIRPMVLALLCESAYQGIGVALEHQQLTHRSESIASGLTILLPLLFDLMEGMEPKKAILRHARHVRLPKITGEELYTLYKEHEGPQNIDREMMWELHMTFRDEPLDLEKLVNEHTDEEVIKKLIATACYPEHGVPLILYLLYKYHDDFEQCLLANVNAGGDNVHRGMLLGMLAGAMSDTIPIHLIDGLKASDALRREIDDFCDIALGGAGI